MSPALDHPLRRLDARRLGPYSLRLDQLRPAEKSGWWRFDLTLTDAGGDFAPPVIEGVYSAGGRGVRPWIEVLAYEPVLGRREDTLGLAERGWEQELFAALGELVPPGGHLMVGCETPPHQETYQALLKGVPPAATPLGAVLFGAGFRKVKFFYLAEGGWEGQQKLWAEKPVNEAMGRDWEAATAEELRKFLASPVEAAAARHCQPRAQQLLAELTGAGGDKEKWRRSL